MLSPLSGLVKIEPPAPDEPGFWFHSGDDPDARDGAVGLADYFRDPPLGQPASVDDLLASME